MFVLGLVLIVGSCFLCGRILSDELLRRQNNLDSLRKKLSSIQNEITFKINPIADIVEKISSSCDDLIGNIFKEICRKHHDNKRASENFLSYGAIIAQEFSDNQARLSFQDNDISIINDFAEQVGNTDINGQKKLFESVISRMDERIEDAKKEYASKGRMYNMLGLGVGIIIAIMVM